MYTVLQFGQKLADLTANIWQEMPITSSQAQHIKDLIYLCFTQQDKNTQVQKINFCKDTIYHSVFTIYSIALIIPFLCKKLTKDKSLWRQYINFY